jgi:hypothetical protein
VLDQVTGGAIEIKELDVVASVTGNKLLDAFLGGFYTAGGR